MPPYRPAMALTNVPQNKSEGTMRKFLMLTMMLAAPAMAQVPAGAKLGQTGAPGPNKAAEEYSRPRQVISPIIHADRSVTLKVNAPLATEVRVTGHIIGPNAH
jgi:hypothetical protein